MISAGQGYLVYQASQGSEGSADYTACQAPKAFLDPQVLMPMETQGSQAPLETGVTGERPTHFQALWELQGRKESGESQGNVAQPETQDFRVSLVSLHHPTSLGYLVTWGHQEYLACKATKALQDHLGQMHFLESKETKEALELRGSPERKDGWGTQGPRASLGFSVFQGRKGPRVSKDSWATPGPLGLWVTEAPKDPKATKDSQVLLALWGPQAFPASPRRSLSSLGPWVPRAGEAFPVRWER